ncbi:MAG: sugar phosphate nucleotidyltransferase [Pseudomonadota bacterium]
MKVVIFCGGLGTRLRENSQTMPKPLVNIGYRPIVWHLMNYYAYHGHKDFVLCLGYRGDLVKEYFLNYRETDSNNFTMKEGGKVIEHHATDIHDWTITFAETGLHSNLGQRLLAVKDMVKDEEMFLANYSDGLSDIPINEMIEKFDASDAVASFAAVRTWQSFHAAKFGDDNLVNSLGELTDDDFWINGGFFVMKPEIFDVLNEGEELVEEPFGRLIEQRKLLAYPHNGYWRAMDTFKDKISFERDYARGRAPWEIWNK